MIKVEYVLDGTKGELELTKLTSFDSKEEILESWDKSSCLENYLVEDTLALLKPEVDAVPVPAVGGASGDAKVQAEKFGFTQFIAKLDGQTLVIC
ncbi:hypothetical protein MCT05_18775 [Vibrio aestuarianus]|nr:hypothetical protein [Vibrio aestuarianus]MDE1222760.1 hypothetical protein [Vibrio aestuarianus]